jgi:hypothetical protein
LYTLFKTGISLTILKKTENISAYGENYPKRTDILGENLQNIPNRPYI